MNESSLDDFLALQERINKIPEQENWNTHHSIIEHTGDAIMQLIWLHYPVENKKLLSYGRVIERRVKKVTDNKAFGNPAKLNDLQQVIANVIQDVRGRLAIQRSKVEPLVTQLQDNVSLLEGQLNRAKFDLTNTENEKAKLREEIQRLQIKTTTDDSELGKYQESVAKHNREKTEQENTQIKQLKTDYQLLQSDITALRTEKEILQEKLERSKKDLEKEKNKPAVVVNKLSETVENFKLQTKSNGEKDFYKWFLTSTYILISYVWLSTSTIIVGFVVKDNFKYGIVVAVLILYGVLFFSNRERIKDNIVQFIIAIGAVVLSTFFFYR